MAKAKTKALTAEGRLAEAIVPESEQPYAVPGNWVWTRLGDIATIIGGGTPSSSVAEYYDEGDISWITPADLSNYESMYISVGRKNITRLGLNKSSARLMPKDTVLLSSRAPIGYVAIAEKELCTNQGFKSFLPSPAFMPEYLFFYLKYSKEMLESYASGTTFLELSGSKAALVELPLPPLAEQQRMVARIESLFGKLDRAKELVQSALDSFETRKAAILHKALTGELTAKWREKNGVGMDSWDEKPLKAVAKLRSGYAFDSKDFTNAGYQVIRMGNLYNGVLDISRAPVYMNKDTIDDVIREKFSAKQGDILLTLTGTKYKRDYGYAVLIEEDRGFLVNQRILTVTPVSVEQNLLLHYLQSDLFRNVFFSNETGGVNQGNVSSTFVGNISIFLPTLPEQQEIVRILDSLLRKEQRARELCDVIDKIDLMKKAILARAFRGELGTGDPSEESAMELLKEVMQ